MDREVVGYESPAGARPVRAFLRRRRLGVVLLGVGLGLLGVWGCCRR